MQRIVELLLIENMSFMQEHLSKQGPAMPGQKNANQELTGEVLGNC